MRLDSIAGSDGSAISLYYDPFQRLVSRHWSAPRGDDALYFDGPDVVLELRYPSAGGSQWVRYVHGPGADQPLATEVYPLGAAPTPGAGSQYYYHADGEGSIRLLTDANGQIANRYDYDSYGQRLNVIESLPLQPYGWKGREWIPGPNIYYNRARFYDPVLGRFMSQDPLGYEGGDSNLYSFAWNNPRNWNDPKGLSALSDAAAANVAAWSVGCGASAGALAGAQVPAIAGAGAAGEYAATNAPILAASACAGLVGADLVCVFNQIAEVLGGPNPTLTQCGASHSMIVETPPNWNGTQQQQIEFLANKAEYKRVCDEPPPPGGDACDRARWELNKAKQCLALREANNERWYGGKDDKHNSQLYSDIQAQINSAESAVNRWCK